MAEPTAQDPLGVRDIDQHGLIRQKLFELVSVVNPLPHSRTKSMMLTKLDEFRHWAQDDEAIAKQAGED